MDEVSQRADSNQGDAKVDGAAEHPADGDEADPSALLHALEVDTGTTEFGFERARVFKRAADLYRARGDEASARRIGAVAALFDFDLVSRGARRSEGRGRFQPQWEFGGQAYPHVKAFDPEALDAIAAQLAISKNPIHRSRCADFLWECRLHHTYARQAIDAYMEAADLYQTAGWHTELCDALDRAAELSLQLRDQALISRAKAAGFRVAEALLAAGQHPEVRWSIDALETQLGFGRHLTADERSAVAKLAERGAAFYADEGDHHLEQSFLAIIARTHGALHPDEAREARRRFGASLANQAEQADSHLIAAHFLREAVQAYAELGDPATVEALKRRLAEEVVASESEFVTISTEVTMPTAPLKAWIERLLALTLDEALEVVAASCMPKIDAVRSRADELRRKFPLRYLATNLKFQDRRIVGAAASEDEHEEMSIIESYLLNLQLSDIQLGLAFERLEAEKGLAPETLMQFLRQGQLFDPDTLDMVAVGVDRYFAGDYVSALHVLIPQLEDVLRGFLGKLGVATTSFRDGLTREKTLDIVLEEPALRRTLGEDLVAYLEVLLIKPEGLNLRNLTGHGLMKGRDCTRLRVQRVIHCFLLLTGFVAGESSEDDEGAPQS